MGRATIDAVVLAIDSLLVWAYDAEQLPDAFVSWTRANMPVERTCSDREIFGDRLPASRVWREWMVPHEMCGGPGSRLLEAGRSFRRFDAGGRGRNKEALSREDIAMFGHVAPIMARVAELRRHIGLLALQRDMARDALDLLSVAIIIADAQMRLVYANELAETSLAEPGGALRFRSGRIGARNPRDHAALKRLVAEAHMPVPGRSGGRSHLLARASGPNAANLSLCVLPVPAGYGLPEATPCVMIAARPLEAAADLSAAAQQLFGLTETEARFASALAAGLSLAQAAEDQRVRISTARTHLARIFQKTGTRQQSQVAALLRSVELPVRPRDRQP